MGLTYTQNIAVGVVHGKVNDHCRWDVLRQLNLSWQRFDLCDLAHTRQGMMGLFRRDFLTALL